MSSVGFIGGGRVTRILVGGWARAGALPGRILVREPDEQALDALRTMVPTVERLGLTEAARADVVFLALHPPAIAPTLAALRSALSSDGVLVSLAPKVTLATLVSGTGTERVARMIPNAPSLMGQGYNPVAYGPGLDAGARATLAALFEPWGRAPEVAEEQLEAYALLTGMGPTYFWFQWQTLRDVAHQLGLPHAAADAALRGMLTGALATLLDSDLTPTEVMDLVPVKPLSDLEPVVTSAYRTALPSLHARIRPGEAQPHTA